MTDIPEPRANSVLPFFLLTCIEKGVLDRKTALSVDKIRRSSDIFAPILSGIIPDSRLGFDTLVPCQENALAFQLARMASDGDANPATHNPIYIYGKNGTGKTHLLSAIANDAFGSNALFINSVDMETEYERTVESGRSALFVRWIRSYEMLIIDDIQHCHENKKLQRQIALLIEKFISDGRLFIASGNVEPSHLEDMEHHLISRLACGIQVELRIGNSSERLEILRRSIDSNIIPEEVMEYLAERIDDSILRLKAVANQLVTIGQVLQEPITIMKADAIIREKDLDQTSPDQNVVDQSRSFDVASPDTASETQSSLGSVDQFRRMMVDAETTEEQALALQIALGERIRQLREDENGDQQALVRFEKALELLREGKMEQAIQFVSN